VLILKLRVTDIKQYVYCPRIIYYTYVCPVKAKITRKMTHGKETHLELDRLEKRRTFKRYQLKDGERHFHTRLYSPRFELEGILDLHITAGEEIFPVEFKHTSSLPSLNHKYQLAAYAMLLEEEYERAVRYGFLYLSLRNEIYPVDITPNCREFVKETMDKIRQLVSKEIMPPPVRKKGRCVDCEFRNFCRDVG